MAAMGVEAGAPPLPPGRCNRLPGPSPSSASATLRSYGQPRDEERHGEVVLRPLPSSKDSAAVNLGAAGAAGRMQGAAAARQPESGWQRRVRRSLGRPAVCLRVDDAGEELAFDVPVPVVLDLIVGAARQLAGDERPPVREERRGRHVSQEPGKRTNQSTHRAEQEAC